MARLVLILFVYLFYNCLGELSKNEGRDDLEDAQDTLDNVGIYRDIEAPYNLSALDKVGRGVSSIVDNDSDYTHMSSEEPNNTPPAAENIPIIVDEAKSNPSESDKDTTNGHDPKNVYYEKLSSAAKNISSAAKEWSTKLIGEYGPLFIAYTEEYAGISWNVLKTYTRTILYHISVYGPKYMDLAAKRIKGFGVFLYKRSIVTGEYLVTKYREYRQG